ncbi:MAG: hypothetical protein KKD33_09590 [Verrucomicrobia bacterium]|nr:hypothetical protein [Verrucomicrobiota bacterium]MBU4366792.1 hypothetical protein [Verrucomicrobiota bacterium]
MNRHASESVYFHRDFHGALSCGIEYLHEHYGENAVREFLREFALTFYAPLRQALREKGLVVLKDHFEAIYRLEGGEAQFDLSEEELLIRMAACPAVRYMRANGYPVARLFCETTRTVNETLCEDTPYVAELVQYDPQTGRSVQRFSRRPPVECASAQGGEL